MCRISSGGFRSVAVGASISMQWLASWFYEDDEIIVVSEFLASLDCYRLRLRRNQSSIQSEHQSGIS